MTKNLRVKNKRKERKRTQTASDAAAPAAEPKAALGWFPGHMKNAMKEVIKELKNVDILLEMRDARAPLRTSNESFIKKIEAKSRLIVLNKSNLANPENIKLWEAWFEQKQIPFIFINALETNSLMKIVQVSQKIVTDKRKAANPDALIKSRMRMMIIGLPNTGKSTLINKLAKRDATKVADKPGLTRQQLLVKVNKDLEILDTPGIMPPVLKTQKQLLSLAAINAIPEAIVDPGDTALFILNYLFQANPNILSTFYKIEFTPTENESEVTAISILDLIGQRRGCIRAKNVIDYERVYKIIINDFRKGSLGPISFETPPL